MSDKFYTKQELKQKIEQMKKVPWWYRLLPNIFQGTSWFLGKAMFIIFTKLKIVGKNNLKEAIKIKNKQKAGVIFIANHISELDPMLVVSGIFPWTSLFPMFYVSLPMDFYKKAKHFGWRRFVYGPTLFYLWGAHPIIWKVKDYQISLTRHIHLLENGVSLCIFPQGRMSKKEGTGIDEVRGGAGFLALKTKSVVVPVSISGARDITMKEFFSFKRKIQVTYGKPFSYQELLDIEKECKNEDNKYKCVVAKLSEEIKNNL